MFNDPEAVSFIDSEGNWSPSQSAEEYAAELNDVTTEQMQEWYKAMLRSRAFDIECTNLQRQGQLALWAPSQGQEGCQSGLAYAAGPDDHIFPAYREHLIGDVRGVDLAEIAKQFRGVSHGGWDVLDPKNGNFHLYTLVLGAQAQHAQGFALGQVLETKLKAANTELEPGEPGTATGAATMVFYGDGTTSQGDANEAMVFAASYQTPTIFVVQNNYWAISVPVTRQSRTPLYRRALGFGIPSVQIDGNDAIAAYAVGRRLLRSAREGGGPAYIEALTYRIGAHTTSDDPTRYRADDQLEEWRKKDPITRFEQFLKSKGVAEEFFVEAKQGAADNARAVRERILNLPQPDPDNMFANVYAEEHPRIEEQREWLARYEASFEEGEA